MPVGREEGIKAVPFPDAGEYDSGMADLWVIVAILAFFGLCVAFVWGCDRIIGPDDASDLREADEPIDELPAEAVGR